MVRLYCGRISCALKIRQLYIEPEGRRAQEGRQTEFTFTGGKLEGSVAEASYCMICDVPSPSFFASQAFYRNDEFKRTGMHRFQGVTCRVTRKRAAGEIFAEISSHSS